MHGFLLSLMMLLADPAAPADLTGKVTGPDGSPVAGYGPRTTTP